MKIKVLVPVTGDFGKEFIEMTKYLKPYLMPDTQLVFENLHYGFSSVETETGGMFNGAQVVMKVLSDNTQECQGVLVDCFDDPGVYACREMGKVPVVGPYQASVTAALMLAERIGIITTDQAGILNEEKKARDQGLTQRIVSIRSLDLMVADIRAEKEKVLADLELLCEKMVREDRVSAICLGCTAMYYVVEELRQRLKAKDIHVNIIEPFLCGILSLETMLRQGFDNYIPGGVDFSGLHWTQAE